MSTANPTRQKQRSQTKLLGLVVAALVLALGAFIVGRTTGPAHAGAAQAAAQAPATTAQAAHPLPVSQRGAAEERDLGPFPDTNEGSNAMATRRR